MFGDGGEAALIEYDDEKPSFLSSFIGSEGEKGNHLYCSNLSYQMFNEELMNTGNIIQNGREMYKWAVPLSQKVCKKYWKMPAHK